MGVFGDRLRREREMRGINLDEIAESTKISRRHLESLEKDQFDQLPGGVFNKGFVRAYARFLGIDEEQAVADYALASNEQPEPEDKFPLQVHEEPNRELNPRRSSLPLIFALAALAGVLVGYFFYQRSKPKNEHNAGPTQEMRLQEPAAKTPISTNEPAPAQTAPSAPQKARVAEAGSPTRGGVARGGVEEAGSPTRGAVARGGVEEAPAKPAEKSFSIRIKAKENAWVFITADGKFIMQDILTADRQKVIKAARQIVLKTGNAGGIDVLFNGRSLGALGNENETRTLTFNATGLVQ